MTPEDPSKVIKFLLDFNELTNIYNNRETVYYTGVLSTETFRVYYTVSETNLNLARNSTLLSLKSLINFCCRQILKPSLKEKNYLGMS